MTQIDATTVFFVVLMVIVVVNLLALCIAVLKNQDEDDELIYRVDSNGDLHLVNNIGICGKNA